MNRVAGRHPAMRSVLQIEKCERMHLNERWRKIALRFLMNEHFKSRLIGEYSHIHEFQFMKRFLWFAFNSQKRISWNLWNDDVYESRIFDMPNCCDNSFILLELFGYDRYYRISVILMASSESDAVCIARLVNSVMLCWVRFLRIEKYRIPFMWNHFFLCNL